MSRLPAFRRHYRRRGRVLVVVVFRIVVFAYWHGGTSTHALTRKTPDLWQ